jgi:hypothetical protein
MAYVPPHLRKQKTHNSSEQTQSKPAVYRQERYPETKKPEQVGTDNSEKNFPQLGDVKHKSSWIGRKFAELASEWNQDDEKRKEDAELRQSYTRNYTVVLPRFQNIQKFEEEEEAQASPASEVADEWKTIERKKQQKPKELKEKTFEEYEKEAEKQEKEDETVWDVPEHETCWDERY